MTKEHIESLAPFSVRVNDEQARKLLKDFKKIGLKWITDRPIEERDYFRKMKCLGYDKGLTFNSSGNINIGKEIQLSDLYKTYIWI